MKKRILQMKWTKKIVLIALLLGVAGLGKMFAQSFTVGDLNYQVNNDGISVTVTGHVDGQSATGSLVIPETVEYSGSTYSVTAIGDWAFSGCSGFTGNLIIPNSVIEIGANPFSGCSGIEQIMVEINNPNYDSRENCNAIIETSINKLVSGCKNSVILDVVTMIGSAAFSGCSGLTGSLTLPNSVTTIGDWAFSGCSGLTGSLTLPNSVTTIGYAAFSGCSGFTGDLVIPDSVTTIGASAFSNCSGFTGSLTIGNSVTTIDNSAFSGCSGFTGNLTIGNSVTTIGGSAFSGCSGFTGSLTIPNSVTTIGGSAFSGCSGFTGTLTIPNSVTTIGEYAFYTCSGLTGSLTIPNSVTRIGNYAFYGCSFIGLDIDMISIPNDFINNVKGSYFGLLTLGNSVTEIGNLAFSNCSGLTGNLTIPNSVTTIGVSAFSNCSGFTGSLTIDNSVIEIGSHAFYNCSGFTDSLTIGNSVTTIGSYAFSGCSSFTEVHYNATNCADASLGYGSFYDCSGSLVIGDNVERIPAYMFSYCSGFTGSLTIGNSVTTIGEYAFSNCSGFTGSLTIGNSVTEIGDDAFGNCSGFTGSLTIPNSVTTIGNSAFGNCSGFTGSLTIGNSVTTIGYEAFYNCSGFTGSLTIGNSVTEIGDDAFRDCSGFTGTLTIPNSVTTIGEYAFYTCSGFTGSLTIGNSVTTIGGDAFSSCSGFTGDLTLPNSVTAIGESAFSYCSGFTGRLTIGNSVTTIGSGAFLYCPNFDSIVVESGNTVYDSRESCNALIKTSTNELILGCKNSIIPNSVTEIGNYAFSNCSGLTGSLTIGNSVTTIGIYAFENCIGLRGSLTIGNSVTTIGDWAFSNCIGLRGSLTIGNSVTTIGDYAFYRCIGLNEIMMLGTTPPSLGYYVFSYTNDCPIYVPYESLNDYKTATYWSSYQSRIFPMAYTSIPGYGVGEGNYRFIASPLVENTAPTAVDNMITETAYDLYRFDQSENDEWQNYKYPENTPNFFLTNGQGYLYANVEDVNLVFKGAFNEDDTKEVGLAYDANAEFAGWNLVGNPFPVSAYASRSCYTMNEDGTGIEPNMVSSATAIPACTGVMVMAEAEGETVVFSTEAPEATTNQGCLQIAVAQTNERGTSTGSVTALDKAIVSFNVGDRLEKFVFNKENAVISISQGGKELAIACSDKQGEIPLNFKATKNGEYTLTINPEAVELDYLHLIDNLTGADVDLLALRQAQGPANYTFEAKTTDYASRFRLVFSGKEADSPSTGSETFAFISNGSIVIIGAEADAVLQIVDMQGRIIVCCDAAHHVSIDGMTSGVYVLRLIEGESIRTQKIVIE